MQTETLETPQSACTGQHKSSWLQRQSEFIVLNALKQMTAGYLKITLPDNQLIEVGNRDAHIRADVQIHHQSFFTKVLFSGHIGFAEAYMDGSWETTDIEQVISWAILNVEQSPMLEGASNKNKVINLLGAFNKGLHWLRKNSLTQSRKNIAEHYDLSNDFFKLFLDPTMTYSSAKFDHPDQSLEDAQKNKYDAICKKVRLCKEDHVLEIGTGWGGFALHAATNYGCRVTTITISQEQFDLATRRVKAAGLENLVDIQLKDYRELTGQFDKIVSIEMIEAVGDQYMDTFIDQCTQRLKKDGLLAIQMITCPDSRYDLLRTNVDFIQKHIFPGSLLPSVGRINTAVNRVGTLSLFEMEDMGLSYAKTLRIWHQHFNNHIDTIRKLGFDDRFIRKWRYYFNYCAAAFQMRNISVVQAVYTHPNNLTLNKQETLC